MSDPHILSIDCETYGACEHDGHGRALPPQTLFHPTRSMVTDGCPRSSLVLICAVTPLRGSHPRDLEPLPTMVFELHNPLHRLLLRRWLLHAHILVGMNLPFDLLYLRASGFTDCLSPCVKSSTPTAPSHELWDLSVVNYLESEMRPERSLKTLGPILGTHDYSRLRTLRDGHRFRSPSDPDLHRYCAADTLFTAHAIRTLARRIPEGGPKLSRFCLQSFSDSLWLSVAMSESGVPYDRPSLESLAASTFRAMATARDRAMRGGLLLGGLPDRPKSGEGSIKSQEAFIARVLEAAPSVLSDPRLERTAKTKAISWSDSNRRLFTEALPPRHPLSNALALADRYETSQKTLTSFLRPLLVRSTGNSGKSPFSNLALPSLTPHPARLLAFPSWLMVPSFVKDGGGDDGGTIQARPTCKGPAVQTQPDPIRRCIRSRWPGGHVYWMDLNQAERRMAALLSGDPVMHKEYADGRDSHADLAEELARLTGTDLTAKYGPAYRKHPDFKDKWRQPAKHANFTVINLGGAETLQTTIRRKAHMDVPLSLCVSLIRAIDSLYHVFRSWQTSLIDQVCRDRILVMPLIGESRYFRGSPSTIRDTYSATIVNFPIQWAAAQVQKAIQYRLLRTLPPTIHQCANIYDSVVLDCHPSLSYDAVHALCSEAVDHVASPSGFYGLLCAHVGRSVPLRFDLQEKT